MTDQPDQAPQPDQPPAKPPFKFRNVTGTPEAHDLQIFGWDVPGRSPPPIPPQDELQQAADSPHRFPDIPQPPTREQCADDAAFAQAKAGWIERYAPTIARRNGRKLERLQFNPGATAQEISDVIRDRVKKPAE